MGVRLYTENSVIPRLRVDAGEAQSTSPPPANPALGRSNQATQQIDLKSVAHIDSLALLFSDFIGGPDNPAMSVGGSETNVNQAVPAVTDDAGEDARTGISQDSDANPTPRIQSFRFLMAAETARDLELQARQDKLEQKLETLNDRARLAGTLIAQIDAKLERARLEQELDTVGSDIRRLRLEHVFDKQPSSTENAEAALATPQAAGAAFEESQASESDQTPVLNLLA